MAGIRLKNIPEGVNAANFRVVKESGRQQYSNGRTARVAHKLYEAVDPIEGTVLGHFGQLADRGQWFLQQAGAMEPMEHVFKSSAEVCIYAARWIEDEA